MEYDGDEVGLFLVPDADSGELTPGSLGVLAKVKDRNAAQAIWKKIAAGENFRQQWGDAGFQTRAVGDNTVCIAGSDPHNSVAYAFLGDTLVFSPSPETVIAAATAQTKRLGSQPEFVPAAGRMPASSAARASRRC